MRVLSSFVIVIAACAGDARTGSREPTELVRLQVGVPFTRAATAGVACGEATCRAPLTCHWRVGLECSEDDDAWPTFLPGSAA